MKHTKVIIGGGAGLCGSWLSRYLLDRNYKVIILDDLSESYAENVDERAKFYITDCNYTALTDSIFRIERPDYCYSMQAHAAEILSPFKALNNYQNNLLSVINLSNLCIKYEVKKHIVFSSIAVYGHQVGPFYETTPLVPADPYGISKMAIENHARVCKEQFHLDFSVVRPHNFQGKYVNLWSKYRNFIGIAVREALQNKNIPVFSDGLQTRQISDIQYLCDPLEKLLTKNIPLVNIGAEMSYKIIDIANMVKKIAHQDGKNNVEIEHLPKRHESLDAACNHDLAKKELNFEDKTDIEKLCYDIYHWAKNQPVREVKKVKYEITNGMPSSWL